MRSLELTKLKVMCDDVVNGMDCAAYRAFDAEWDTFTVEVLLTRGDFWRLLERLECTDPAAPPMTERD